MILTLQDANSTAEDAISLLLNMPDKLAKNSALVLKTIYDVDVLEAIVEWHKSSKQSSLAHAVSKANAFVEWLTAADEDTCEWSPDCHRYSKL